MFLDFLEQEIGESKDAGTQERFNCPFCGETKHKFYVNKDNGLWLCFKCSEKGNPVSFVMKFYNMSYTEAVDVLSMYDYDVEAGNTRYSPTQYGDDLTPDEQLFLFISREGEPIEDSIDTSTIFTCPSPPTNIKSLSTNFDNPEAFVFFDYLHKRGVSLEQIYKHNISYVTYGQVTLIDGRQMDLVNHLIFYTLNDKGRPIYWNTRSIEANPFIKSFNAPSKKNEYSKNNTIFNLNNAKKTDRIVINEGVFDALTIGDSGVATFGKKITDKQIDLLVSATKKNNIPIYLFLDTDAVKETMQTVKALQSKTRTPVYLVINNTGKDANDLGREKSEELIKEAVLADSDGQLIYYLTNLL